MRGAKRVFAGVATLVVAAGLGPGAYWLATQLQENLQNAVNEALTSENVAVSAVVEGRDIVLSGHDSEALARARDALVDLPGRGRISYAPGAQPGIVATARPELASPSPSQSASTSTSPSPSVSVSASPSPSASPSAAPEPPSFAALLFLGGTQSLADPNALQLDQIATALAEYPQWRVRLTGHTDNGRSASDRIALGQRRAEVVRDALIAKGVSGEQILVDSKGDADPVASNDTREGRAQNRRVEILIEGA